MEELDEEKIWKAVIYLRRSKNDHDKNTSIENQREMLLYFASCNPDICVMKILADEGFSGASFDRSAFKDMIKYIEDGQINCVIVKDAYVKLRIKNRWGFFSKISQRFFYGISKIP